MKKTYVGSCHCGTVRFEADIDLNEGTFKCNCTICTKTRMWGVVVKPDAFRLLAGEDHLTEYPLEVIHRYFCKTCGVHLFGWGESPDLGGKFYGIRLNTLDNVDPQELIDAPLTYFDGRNENFAAPPAETRHL